MAELIIEPSATAAWHAAVSAGARRARAELDEERESYLVFLLMRYTREPGLARAVLALEYLEAMHCSGGVRGESLQAVGDKCLLYAGLFPDQARRRRVSPSYFVDLGKSAYDGVAESSRSNAQASLFQALAATFVLLADVLRALRARGDGGLLSALEAAELTLEAGSALGRRELARHTDAAPVAGSTRKH